MAKELERIHEEDGIWKRIIDGSEVSPRAKGEPIVSTTLEDSSYMYHFIKEETKRKNLQDEVNAYCATTKNDLVLSGFGRVLLAAQLYKI